MPEAAKSFFSLIAPATLAEAEARQLVSIRTCKTRIGKDELKLRESDSKLRVGASPIW